MAIANKIQIGRGRLSSRLQDTEHPILPGELFEATYRESPLNVESGIIYDGVTGAKIASVEVGDAFIGVGERKITKIGTGNVLHIVGNFDSKKAFNAICDLSQTADTTNGAIYAYSPAVEKSVITVTIDGREEVLCSGDMVIFLNGEPAYKISNCATADSTLFDATQAPNIQEAIDDSEYISSGIDVNYVDGAIYYLDHNKFQFGGKGIASGNQTYKYTKYPDVGGGTFLTSGELSIENIDSWVTKDGNFFQITGFAIPDKKYYLVTNVNSNQEITGYERLYKNDLLFVGFNGRVSVVHTGASNAEDVEYKKEVSRGNAFAEASFTDKDSQIATAKDALDNLFETKADLVNGKIPTSELPETVLGSLQYKGTTSNPDGCIKLKNNGDYVIWNGEDTPVNSLIVALRENIFDENVKVSYNAETTQLVRKGDWIVVDEAENSDNDEGTATVVKKISIIDHTEGFTQFAAKNSNGDTETGTKSATIEGSIRNGTSLPEVEIEAQEADGSLVATLKTPNAVLYDPDTFTINTILVGGANGVAQSSPLQFSDDYTYLYATCLESIYVPIGRIHFDHDDNRVMLYREKFAYLSDVKNLVIGDNDYHAKFITDEVGNKKLVSSNLKDVDDGIRLTGGATIVNSLKDWEGTSSESADKVPVNASVQKLPTQSGTLLNTSSIIDGGVWL